MGPEKIILYIPINLNEEKSTFLNPWLIPILNKYTVGASLRCFMDHIVPVADSVQKMCKKGAKPYSIVLAVHLLIKLMYDADFFS
jgi:ribosomal RNA-processing protein 12